MIATIERDVIATEWVSECGRDIAGRATLIGDHDTKITLSGLRGSENDVAHRWIHHATKVKLVLSAEVRTAPDLPKQASELVRKGDMKGATRLAIEAMQEIAKGER